MAKRIVPDEQIAVSQEAVLRKLASSPLELTDAAPLFVRRLRRQCCDNLIHDNLAPVI